jgi:anti-sigma factor RsiW
MSEGNKKAADGAALWDRARLRVLEDLAAAAPEIDEGDLAAYLDGSLDGGLDGAERARIEAALASQADSLDSLELLIASREALAGPTPGIAAPEAPSDVVARAQALVPEPRPRAEAWIGEVGAWGALLDPRRGLAFAGVAAGFLVISVAGFELGRAEVAYNTQIGGLLAQDFVGLVERDGEDLL